MHSNKITFKYLFIFSLFFVLNTIAYAQTADEIKAKITETTNSKAQLEKEIADYENQLKSIGQQASTLQNTIKSLDATINKNALQIKLTQNNINETELEIQQLSFSIIKDNTIIDTNERAIAGLIVQTARADNATIIEILLAHKNLSEFWNELENIFLIQNQISEKVAETKNTKKILEDNKRATENKKAKLLALKASLQDQKAVLVVTKNEKSKLLAQTKNKESNYQKILADKKALSLAFDKELLQFESQLKLIIDPNSYPSSGKGILLWPLNVIKITQYFGDTEFSKTTTAYNGHGHNGVDFGAAIGTPVKAALSGTVVGTGNTDTVCPGGSFGKWIFIQHNNGLSTIYAHLSLMKVQKGDKVFAGDVIGYTGLTGYTTGPHLHFGLYVTQGVKIMDLKSRVCSGTYTMPVADLKAYLDPLQYL